MLNVTKTIENETGVFELEGSLDAVTSHDLNSEIAAVLGTVKDLIIDMEKLEYISSAGLRVLVTAIKGLGGKDHLKIINVNDTVMEVFELTGFSGVLNIVR